jgi:hypothetical protein
MRGSLLRRISSGLFLVWYAVFGLTRGSLGVCAEHGATDRRATGAVHASVSGAHQNPTQVQDHGAHDSHGVLQGHAAGLTDVSPAIGVAVPADESPSHNCDCRGECCCCATVRFEYATSVSVASDIVLTTSQDGITPAPNRLIIRVHFSRPFATGPPLEQAA